MTRRPGKMAFWIYRKNWETRMGKRVHSSGKVLVIQAYTEAQAVSFYVKAFLRQSGSEAVKTAQEYFARLVHGPNIESQMELNL